MVSKNSKQSSGQGPYDYLIAELSSRDIRTIEKARLRLLALGKEAVPGLVKALENEERNLRWEAAKTLAQMRDPDLAPVLTAGLENRDPDIRWLSAEGLLALGPEGLSPLLSALIKNPTSMTLIQGAHHILQDLYLKRRHEGEKSYYSLHDLGEEVRQKLKPVLQSLEADEPSHTLPTTAKAALDSLARENQTGKS